MSDAQVPAVERRSRVAPPLKGVERAKLLDELAALHQRHSGDAAAFRRAAVETLRAALDAGRDEARRTLEAGGTGRACAETLSAETDELLRVGLEMSARWLAPAQSGGTLPTIVAVGGYGRGMLAPFSDVDVLFLMPDKSPPGMEKVVEALLYVLWDLKLKVGHATRTIDECLKQARADMTIRTTLVEARFITGDKALFETLRTRFDKEIVAKTAAEFVAAKLAERETRVRKAGASRYLVEPNVKEGKGGLRDLNTLFWISKYVYRVSNPSELVDAGLFSPREFALFRRCEEFLWSVRCRLHFLAGRAEERLSFDVQRPIARQLGYSTRAGLIDVERFMKHYFLIAKDVGDLTAIVCAALEERHAKTDACVRPPCRAPAEAHPRDRGSQGFQGRQRSRQRRPRRRFRTRSCQPHPAVLDRRSVESANSSRRDPACHTVLEAHRRPLARGQGGEPAFSRDPYLAQRARNRAPPHERSWRARPVHPRFRPRRRHDAILDVPPLHRR